MRKNILIFGHGYKHGFIAATNQYTELFNPEQYDVTVVYLDGEPNESITEQHLAKNVIFLNTSNRDKRGFKRQTIKKMLALHQEKEFQIVVCHRYKPSYIMLLAGLFQKIPMLVCVMHDMGTFKNISRRLLITLLGNKNTLIAGVSNAVGNDLRNSIPKCAKVDIATLYNAINIEETEAKLLNKTQARAHLNIKDDTFLFGILGRLVEAKDHQTLITAFSRIKANCPNAKLIIIGDGELHAVLHQQISALDLENDVILAGYLPDAYTLLTALDTFVLSSQQEAFGRVLLEAMVAKCPIIATKTDGVPEVLGNIGALVDKKNPVALANAMQAFYNMSLEERQKQSELSYERAVTLFSLTKFKATFWQRQISLQ